MKFKKKTPFIRRIPISGGQFYTFQSAAEDLNLNIGDNSTRKFRFSKFALLNIPPIQEAEDGNLNTVKLNATLGGYKRYNSNTSNDVNYHFANSFQNYCLNLETMIIDDPNYKQEYALTVSERVFFKWLKEVTAIRFDESEVQGLNDVRFVEEEETVNYNRVVKFIGDVDISGNIYGKNATYTEIYVNIPADCGYSSNVKFKTVEDNNYKPLKSFFRTEDGTLNNEIIYGHNFDEIHPNQLDIRANYDVDFKFDDTPPSNYSTWRNNPGLKLFKRKLNNTGINPDFIDTDTELPADFEINKWHYGTIDQENGYLLEPEFTNPTNDYLVLIERDTSNDIGMVKFQRSRLDGICIDFDKESYRSDYDGPIFENLHDLGRTYQSGDFDFNAVLIYYDVYETTTKIEDDDSITYNDNVLATNLFGVLFLDDVKPYADFGGRIESFRKQRASDALNKNGNEFSIKVNLRVDVNNPMNVLSLPYDRVSTVVNENNTLAMNLFLDSLREMVKVSSFLENNEMRFFEIDKRLRRVEDVKSAAGLLERINEVEETLSQLNPNDKKNFDTLQTLINELQTKYNNLLLGKSNLNVALDLGSLQSGRNIELERTSEYVKINANTQNFQYSTNPIFSEFETKTGKNGRLFLSKDLELTRGNSYYRFSNPNETIYKPEHDIIINLDDSQIKWHDGKLFRIYFEYGIDLFANNNSVTIKTNSQGNFDKTIIRIDGGILNTGRFKNSIDIHCYDNKQMKFFVDLF